MSRKDLFVSLMILIAIFAVLVISCASAPKNINHISYTYFVNSIPDGAEVYFDGKFMGLTPLDMIVAVPSEPHTELTVERELLISKLGYYERYFLATIEKDGYSHLPNPIILEEELSQIARYCRKN